MWLRGDVWRRGAVGAAGAVPLIMAVARSHPPLLEPLTAANAAAAAVEEPQRAATHVGRAAAHTPRRLLLLRAGNTAVR